MTELRITNEHGQSFGITNDTFAGAWAELGALTREATLNSKLPTFLVTVVSDDGETQDEQDERYYQEEADWQNSQIEPLDTSEQGSPAGWD